MLTKTLARSQLTAEKLVLEKELAHTALLVDGLRIAREGHRVQKKNTGKSLERAQAANDELGRYYKLMSTESARAFFRVRAVCLVRACCLRGGQCSVLVAGLMPPTQLKSVPTAGLCVWSIPALPATGRLLVFIE